MTDLDFPLFITINIIWRKLLCIGDTHQGLFLCDTQDTTRTRTYTGRERHERTNARHHRPCVTGMDIKSMLWLRNDYHGRLEHVSVMEKDSVLALLSGMLDCLLGLVQHYSEPCHRTVCAHNRETAFTCNMVVDLQGRSLDKLNLSRRMHGV